MRGGPSHSRWRFDLAPAVGGRGLWAVASGPYPQRPRLHRLDPASGRPTEAIALCPVAFVTDLVIRDGTIWLAGDEAGGRAVLVRVEPERDRSEVVWRQRSRSSLLTEAVFDRHCAWVLDRAAREILRVPAR